VNFLIVIAVVGLLQHFPESTPNAAGTPLLKSQDLLMSSTEPELNIAFSSTSIRADFNGESVLWFISSRAFAYCRNIIFFIAMLLVLISDWLKVNVFEFFKKKK